LVAIWLYDASKKIIASYIVIGQVDKGLVESKSSSIGTSHQMQGNALQNAYISTCFVNFDTKNLTNVGEFVLCKNGNSSSL